MKINRTKYNQLINNIGTSVKQAKENAIKAINTELINANWQIGKHIIEFEQNGNSKAEYGSELLIQISKDLTTKYGKGYSKSNIYLCRQFYTKYPKFQTVSGKSKKQPILSWSHYVELLGITDDFARSFYEKQAILEDWSLRELKRQMDTSLFQRLALSKNKKEILQLSRKGISTQETKDIIKDPYIFEFLELPQNAIIKEKDLEKKLIDSLQQFILELGKGFSFVARQHKITIDNTHYYIDLVFYHRILKCFVLIDLKNTKVKHQDIGQMNMYLNYFTDEENSDNDNQPIGIIIVADKNDFLVKYATGGLSNKIFISKYKTYLPNQKQLEQKVNEIINKKKK